MKTYHNEHLTIRVEPHLHLLCQTWVGLPTSKSYRAGAVVSLQLAKLYGIKRWLIDQRQLRLFSPVDLRWFMEELLPEAQERLTPNPQVVIVLNDMNQFGKLGSDLTLRAAFLTNPNLLSRYFEDIEAAHDWLLLKK